MIKTPTHRRFKLILLILGSVWCWGLQAQSSLHCLVDDSWLPVFEVKRETPLCFTGDSFINGSEERLTMLSSPEFAEGFIEVKIVENTRQGVVKSGEVLQFTSARGWFQFAAKVTADRDIEDAYFVMRYEQFGETIFTCREIGSLKAGKPRMITILKRLEYEMPKQLHIYSGTEEIRTNLVPTSYTYRHGSFLLASQ